MTNNNEHTPKKILLLIRSLNIGGAERQVVSLAKSLTALGIDIHVAVKVAGGPLEADLKSIPNVKFHVLGRPGLIGKVSYFFKLRKLIKSNDFDATYGFMPLPNLALLVARTIRHRPLIAWGIRSSGVDQTQYDFRVKLTMRLEKLLSRFADRIITNSQAALDEYRENGYPSDKLTHVPNAINVDRFRPDPGAKSTVREELGIDPTAPLIGIFARIHPMKDHETFLDAARLLLNKVPNAKFICAGEVSEGFAEHNEKVRTKAKALNLENSIHWLGPRTDPERLMAACDLTTLTSNSGEGFPNSVAESLACGTPCVPTDVGDGSLIVKDFVEPIAKFDSEALASEWRVQINSVRNSNDDHGEKLRRSVVERYSPESIAKTTLNLLRR
ncbi:MAG: glycosyltransferase [Chloroflexi bacterium]|jgi:glycosyltransferase involved in cell wall biosynthesis|nr:glycosyltransferase [Chloroflexota bacterium]